MDEEVVDGADGQHGDAVLFGEHGGGGAADGQRQPQGGAQAQRPTRMKDGEKRVGNAESKMVTVRTRLHHHVVRIDDAERTLDLPRDITVK